MTIGTLMKRNLQTLSQLGLGENDQEHLPISLVSGFRDGADFAIGGGRCCTFPSH